MIRVRVAALMGLVAAAAIVARSARPDPRYSRPHPCCPACPTAPHRHCPATGGRCPGVCRCSSCDAVVTRVVVDYPDPTAGRPVSWVEFRYLARSPADLVAPPRPDLFYDRSFAQSWQAMYRRDGSPALASDFRPGDVVAVTFYNNYPEAMRPR